MKMKTLTARADRLNNQIYSLINKITALKHDIVHAKTALNEKRAALKKVRLDVKKCQKKCRHDVVTGFYDELFCEECHKYLNFPPQE